MRNHVRICFLTICTLLAVALAAAQAKVINLQLNTSNVRSVCPAVVHFNGSITVDSPGTVRYIFTRSDGAIDTITKKLHFSGPGTQSVSTTWTLGGAALPYYKGWEAIKVLSPNAMTSAHADFEIGCNPPLNSALAAHGNTDWHIDTANEFLFGQDMNGNVTAPNHAPNSWTKRHMHVGLTNTSKYYFDKTKTPVGMDTDSTNGIDMPMLFFYAGHGGPTGWSTLGNCIPGGDCGTQSNVTLANVAQGGLLRYYWQCSCEVFAHGPKTMCSGSSFEYSCPQNFTGGADSDAMRNVFERWGPALRPDLRMACGASTSAYCHEGNVDKVWDDFNNHGMTVAMSFIDGLSGWGVVPLCITMGGQDITKTPLYDTTFTNEPNTSGASYYHIMYLGPGTASQEIPALKKVKIPTMLPKLKLVVAEMQGPLRPLNLPTVREGRIQHLAFAGGAAKVRYDPAAGAVYMTAAKTERPSPQVLEDRVYLERARNLLREMKWETPDLGEPTVTRLMTASVPVAGGAGQVQRNQSSVVVNYPRQIVMGDNRIPVIGEGGALKVTLHNDGTVMHAARVWRAVRAAGPNVRLKTFEQARDAALRKVGKPEVYQLDRWKWGYKELAGNVRQDELSVVFEFAFVPKPGQDKMQYPPRLVEVPGQAD